jgi:hypothetical protein
MSHLLPLSALHAAAPGVLDVIFGADGDFEGAPPWHGPLMFHTEGFWGKPHTVYWPALWNRADPSPNKMPWVNGVMVKPDKAFLDCRIPSVAARLLRLCSFVQSVDPNAEPDEIASLTLSLAPRIASLR